MFKFAVIGAILAFFVVAFHRRACRPVSRVDRQARCEERRRRRAFRRAAHKHGLRRFIARITGRDDQSSAAGNEEKCEASPASADSDVHSSMTEDITEFCNAADVIVEIIAAEGNRSAVQTRPAPTSENNERGALLHDYDTGSQAGDGEELPAYEDNDGSEMSSVVADGFLYTPGSTQYSPSHSPAGSISDILGSAKD